MINHGSMLSKTLVIGIIFLFIGMSAFPTISNSIRNKTGISLITLKVAGVIGRDNWYGSNNSFTFTYESDEIAEIYYGIDGTWSLYTETFNVPDGEEHILEWYAIDYEGNQSEVDGPFFFKIDDIPPAVELSYEVIGGNPWEFIFTMNATDAMSGMDRVEFYMNDVLQSTVVGPGPVYQWSMRYHGTLYIVIKATAFDKAGNSASLEIKDYPCKIAVLGLSLCNKGIDVERSINSCLDDVLTSQIVERENHKITEKLCSGCPMGEDFDPAYVIVVFNRKIGENGWIFRDVSIQVFYESDRVDEVYYQLNDGGWMLYSDPLVISEDGIYVFSWYVVDSEGYTSTSESIYFKVDLTLPEINLINQSLSENKIKFIAEVYDATSGIDRVIFRRGDGRYFTDYDFPYEWIWTGFSSDRVTATVYDNASNSNSSSMNIIRSRSHSYNQQSSSSLLIKLLERFPLLEVIILRAMNLLR